MTAGAGRIQRRWRSTQRSMPPDALGRAGRTLAPTSGDVREDTAAGALLGFLDDLGHALLGALGRVLGVLSLDHRDDRCADGIARLRHRHDDGIGLIRVAVRQRGLKGAQPLFGQTRLELRALPRALPRHGDLRLRLPEHHVAARRPLQEVPGGLLVLRLGRDGDRPGDERRVAPAGTTRNARIAQEPGHLRLRRVLEARHPVARIARHGDPPLGHEVHHLVRVHVHHARRSVFAQHAPVGLEALHRGRRVEQRLVVLVEPLPAEIEDERRQRVDGGRALAPGDIAVEIVALVRELLGGRLPFLHRLRHGHVLRLEHVLAVVEELHLGIERHADELAAHGGDLAGVGEEIVEGELRTRHRRVRQVLLDRLVPARLEKAQAVPGREAHEAVDRAGSRDHLDRELLTELILGKDFPRDLDARQLLELGDGGTNDLVRPVVAIDQEAQLLTAVALPVEAGLGSDGRGTRHGPSEERDQHRRHAAERYPSCPRRHACLLDAIPASLRQTLGGAMPRRTQAYARAHSSATRAKPLWRSNMKANHRCMETSR